MRVQVVGEDAKLGRLPAADVAWLWVTERVLARAAGEVPGRRARQPAGWKRTIADAVRLRLVAVEPGSGTKLLQLPDPSTEPDGSL